MAYVTAAASSVTAPVFAFVNGGQAAQQNTMAMRNMDGFVNDVNAVKTSRQDRAEIAASRNRRDGSRGLRKSEQHERCVKCGDPREAFHRLADGS